MPCPRIALLAVLLSLLFVSASPIPPRPHILLISVDTLRADHLGAYGYAKDTSPFLDALAKHGLLFENAYVPLPATAPSHASLLTSCVPWRHGVFSNGMPLPAAIDTLAAALQRSGYDTAGTVAISFLGNGSGFEHGFRTFSAPAAVQQAEKARRNAGAVNGEAKRMIDAHLLARGRDPLFLFAHYFDCHYPYGSWQTGGSAPAPAASLIAGYDQGVRHVDEAIRDLYTYAKAKLGPNVIVVVTADHGEQLGEHGMSTGHADIYRETVAVPLIIAGPAVPAARVETAVSTMDIGVTLAKLAGATFARPVDGRDLLNEPEARPLLVAGYPIYTRSLALVDGPKWYVRNFDRLTLDAWVETPAPAADATAKGVLGKREGADAITYAIPYRRFDPYLMVLEHRAKKGDCAMTAIATVPPGVPYWDQPVPFRQSVRLTVPVARLDEVTFTVAPARCAGETTYRVQRIEQRDAPASAYRPTSLFAHLRVSRKNAPRDELFDQERDPGMVQNLIAGDGRPDLDAKLRTLFMEAARSPIQGQKVPQEQIRILRSLGYIQ